MDFGMEMAELDQILLPPIPGPLPPSFFTDIPPGSAAIFSTVLGTRPFRPLPSPVPVHTVRSGSEDDIRNKSYHFFIRYPTITETIITPPTAWRDLYHYFDAADLWMEGAGFLFHVLGHIVKVNITKFNLLEHSAREWAFLNEARLANMVPRQDMLSGLQTPDDHAWFDYDNMTSHDKEMLNSVLYRHCEAFQRKRVSATVESQRKPTRITVEAQRILPAMNLGGPVQIAVEAQRTQSVIYSKTPTQIVEPQRAPYDMPADPYHHFGRRDHKVPPGSSRRLFQPTALHLDSSECKVRADSIMPYRNSQSYRTYRGSFHETPHPAAPRDCPDSAENHYVLPDGYDHFTTGRRQSTHAGHSHRPLRRQLSISKDPVYMLNPQRSLMSLHKEAFGVQGGIFTRTSPGHSSQQLQSIKVQGRNSQGYQEELHYLNQRVMVSNDARSHYVGRLNPAQGNARLSPLEGFKPTSRKTSWPESEFSKVRTVFVTGFPIEAASTCYLERLFSECGEITTISVIEERFYAFITFKYLGSALAAISRFDGYSIEGGKSLTVQRSRGHQRKSSHGNADAHNLMSGASLRPWANEPSSTPIHNQVYESRENQKFMRTTPPRNDGYYSSNLSHNLPPHPFEQARDVAAVAQMAIPPLEPKDLKTQLRPKLPAKPQHSFPNSKRSYSPSAFPKPQLIHAQGPTRTPDKSQHGSGIEQMSAAGRKDSDERSIHTGGRRPYGAEGSKPQRKTPKKQKGPPNDRKTLKFRGSFDALNTFPKENANMHSPVKELPLVSIGDLSVKCRNAGLVKSIALPVPNIQSKANDSVPDIFTANDDVPQVQESSLCGSQRTKVDLSASNSEARSNSVSSISSNGPVGSSALVQQPGLFAGTNTDSRILSSETMSVAAAKAITEVSVCDKQPSIYPKESGIFTELVQQQKKKKYKYKKRSPKRSVENSMEVTTDNGVLQAQGNYPSHEENGKSTVQTRSHSKTSSDATSSSATSTSTQFICANTETTVLPAQKPSNAKASPERKSVGDSSPQNGPEWQSHRKKGSLQSKSSSDDIFQNIKPASIEHTQDTKRIGQGKVDISGPVTPSTSNSNSSSNKGRRQGWEDSQTPTRRPQPRYRKTKSDPQALIPDQKENQKLSPSPTEILSDPLNWPALGNPSLKIDTRTVNAQKALPAAKPLGERPLPPAPIRRDSMASVVSQPSQVIRRLTIDSPNSPVSGGSPLWPVVKRWDGHGRSLTEIGDHSLSTNRNKL